MHAMNACRVEKGYRHWGHDVGVTDTPIEAGLSFTCAWDKPGGFVGRDALARRRDAGVPRRRLLQLRLADPARPVYHEEPVFADGRLAGTITSGMFGHRVGASLAMGWVALDEPLTRERVAATRFEVEVAGERVPADASLAPWYDPASSRVKG